MQWLAMQVHPYFIKFMGVGWLANPNQGNNWVQIISL